MDRAHEQVRPLLRKRAEPDRELEAGARAHFEDPAYYTSTYRTRVDDVVFYSRLAKGVPTVLEYGIGNGRIAVPIARAGTRVTGIDHSAPMLADLRRRVRAEKLAITAKRGDMRRVKLGARFPLVLCPFNTMLHLYERADVEAWLDRVKEHLLPNGELVFDVAMPMVEDLARDPSVPFKTPPFRHPTLGRVTYREHFDYDRARQILFVSMSFRPEDGNEVMTPLAHRQFFPQELEALLHYNGFAIEALMGDFEENPLVSTSEIIVVRARRRTRSGRGSA